MTSVLHDGKNADETLTQYIHRKASEEGAGETMTEVQHRLVDEANNGGGGGIPKASPFTERISYGLGASISSGTITVSPYVLVNGTDEKTSMSAIHVMDGNIHKLKLAYQSGLSDANIDDTIPLEMADSFANAGAKEVYFSINTVHAGQHVLGNSMKTFVADGTELQGWYDSVEDKFFLEEI